MKDYEINENTDLQQIFKDFPVIMKFFIKNNFRCVGCEVQKFETLGEALANQGVKDIATYVAKINEIKHNEDYF